MKKKLLLIAGLFLMATVSLLVSCDDETTSNPPTLEFASPGTSSVQVDQGESVGFVFVVKANLNSMSPLQKVSIIAKYSTGGSDQVLDTNVPSQYDKQFSVTKYYLVPLGTPYGTTITCTVKATDKAGQFVE